MITIRQATKDDAQLIARGFLTAMWISDEQQRLLLPVCTHIAEMDDSLYSWRNTHIAQWEGSDAAVLISYDGAIYADAAARTFSYIRDHGGEDYTAMTHEAEPGEWYVDTLAVFPHYRRKGIARSLLRHAVDLCRSNPTTDTATLYVDPAHPWVVDMYSDAGFRPAGKAFIFGQTFLKMAVDTGQTADGTDDDMP